MAIWEALVDGDKRRLNDDGTLFLLQVFGVGLPPARRLKTRSPQQHGSTDLGFRYDEREMRLGFFFNALNETAAVAKRDEQYAFWRSLSDIPIQLRYTRDDNSVRQIDCHVVGVMDMPWNPDENQNGLQNFVVQVEAANPLWYDPVQDSTSFTQADNLDWWLALGSVTAGQVEEHVEGPAQGQSVDDGVIISDNLPFTIYFRTDAGSPLGTARFPIFVLGSGGNVNAFYYGPTNTYQNGGNTVTGVFASGESDYFAVGDGVNVSIYRDETLIGTIAGVRGIDGSNAQSEWRDRSTVADSEWVPAIPYGAIYNIALSGTQRTNLITSATGDADGGIGASKTITYGGSFLTYPIITITGPITDPILTNVSTGEDLDFTGITIAGGDTYTIDCRFGYKTVKNAAGTNKIADLTAASDLATFHLGADPEVSGGANAFTLTGTGTDANTTVTVTYNERFVGA